MSSKEVLIKATINRLNARIGQKAIDIASEISSIAQNAPEEIKIEWEIFLQEVFDEAERISKEESQVDSDKANNYSPSSESNLQKKIDLLRKKVSELSNKFED
tara:strand:- start:160 stop:468 length:309 start_codon:yes stop_codon:yes gene_type:complete